MFMFSFVFGLITNPRKRIVTDAEKEKLFTLYNFAEDSRRRGEGKKDDTCDSTKQVEQDNRERERERKSLTSK